MPVLFVYCYGVDTAHRRFIGGGPAPRASRVFLPVLARGFFAVCGPLRAFAGARPRSAHSALGLGGNLLVSAPIITEPPSRKAPRLHAHESV